MNVFFSNFKNPYLNLAIEDYLLRDLSIPKPVIFFYVNRPCVVWGRFQNPWRECQIEELVNLEIWPVRRLSGGGCVYQDEGNLNYSFITRDQDFDRNYFLSILESHFKQLRVEIVLGSRHDLWIIYKDKRYKISGSAFKHTKFGWYHHGTLLFNAQINHLENLLHRENIKLETKALKSVPASVINLTEVYPDLSMANFMESFKKYKLISIDFKNTNIQKTWRDLYSYDWVWKETPAFEITTSQGTLKIEKNLWTNKGEFNLYHEFFNCNLSLQRKWFPDFSEQHKSYSRLF